MTSSWKGAFVGSPLFVLLCANKCRFGETVGFRVLRINGVVFGAGMNGASGC